LPIAEYTANSLAEFVSKIGIVKALADARTKVLWFRGQPDSTYDLLPSILRDGRTVALEPELLYRFKAKSLPFITKNIPTSEWGWLFIMQHYGLYTRLLDWTEEACIALTFALFDRTIKHDQKNSVVWCFEPIGLNKGFNFQNQSLLGLIPNIEEQEITDNYHIKHLRSMIPVKRPIAICGPLNNERIIAQRGVFTLFPPCPDIIKLNELQDADQFLYKINIPFDKVDI